MSIEVKVPVLPESVADATIAAWHKKVGDKVTRDENLVDLETDKVVLEVPAPADGVLSEILFQVGDTVGSGQLLAKITAGSSAASAPATPEKQESVSAKDDVSAKEDKSTSPVVRRMMAENDLQPGQIPGSGKEGRITKEDVISYIESNREKSVKSPETKKDAPAAAPMGAREERRVPMTRLRAKVAERLLQAQHNAAMLTTFNEVNLKAVMDMRAQYKDSFEKKHGVKLGFMSFFAKAACEALKRYTSVNAEVRGNNVVYRNYCDIGIAIGGGKGLVVPVLRNVEKMGFAEIERTIGEFASRALANKLMPDDLEGGTFTISNGGIYGSLLSTPIVNPPQSGILGLHSIQERPIALNGEVVIRPMMYLALTYDHRIVDGREAVSFLKTIKDVIEDPSRLFLEI